ncbi:MAG: DUF3072 domain-containing protein [Chloroflexi bacterium]|nr:DUF3072 domain-containing protein [Chloroflexota bacterium]
MADDQVRRDPSDWKTGDEPMTDAQASYLRTLSEEAGETFDPQMTKADASRRIDELQARSPRVQEASGATPPHPSPADGGGEAAERPPRPSQAEGER